MNNTFHDLQLARDSIPSGQMLIWLCLSYQNSSTVTWHEATVLEKLQLGGEHPVSLQHGGCQECIKPSTHCPGELHHIQSFFHYLQRASQPGVALTAALAILDERQRRTGTG